MIKNDNKNAVYWFNLGHVLTKLGKPDSALKAYRKVVTLKSNLAPAANYYLAKLSIETGKIQEGQKILAELMASRNLPANLKSNVDALYAKTNNLEEIENEALEAYRNNDYDRSYVLLKSVSKDKLSLDGHILYFMTLSRLNKWKEFQEKKKVFFKMTKVSDAKRSIVTDLEKNFSSDLNKAKNLTLFLDLAGGENSNVYADGDSVDPLSSIEYRFFGGGVYQWNLGTGQFLRSGYTLFQNSFKDASLLNSDTHNFKFSYLSTSKKDTFEISPYYQMQYWDKVHVNNRIGASSYFAHSLKSGQVGILVDVSKRNSLDDTYSYLNSVNGSGRGFINWWSASLFFELSLSAGHDGTNDIIYSDGSRLPLTHLFYGTGSRLIYRPLDYLQLSLNASYLARTYQNASFSGEGVRSDKEFSYSTRLNYYFIPSTSIYFQYESLKNTSNLGENDVRDKNYHVNTQSIGFTWDYI